MKSIPFFGSSVRFYHGLEGIEYIRRNQICSVCSLPGMTDGEPGALFEGTNWPILSLTCKSPEVRRVCR